MAIKFDLSVLPSNISIRKAVLSLYAYDLPYPDKIAEHGKNNTKAIYVLDSSWAEGSLTWYNIPSNSSEPLDVNDNTLLEVWENFDVTSHISEIVEGQKDNNGFTVRFTDYEPDRQVRYVSSEGVTVYRPKLSITYDSNTSIIKKTQKSPILVADKYLVSVICLNGKKILEKSIHSINEFNAKNMSLPNGAFLIEIKANGDIISKRQIVIH